MNKLTDKRQALPNYTVLDFGTDGDRGYIYTITAESGRGASCIVYQGYYENSLGEKKTVYIKECYPFSLKMKRSASGELSCEDETAFDSYKKRFRESFSLCNCIFESEGLTNTTSNYMDIHGKNGTLYTVITYRQGQELSLSDDRSLKETIRIIKSVAKAIGKIHDNGFLYLDTKPDNIFVLDKMNESIQLFDFDSMIPKDAKGDMSKYRISYTKGFSPLEQRNGRLDMIGEPADVYGVGALLFYMVFGRTPEALDCDPFAVYDFEKIRYESWRYRDRLFRQMGSFFKNTLAVSADDRYPNMSPAIDVLEGLEKDSDLTSVFMRDSYYPVRVGMIGREAEIERVNGFIDQGRGCLFVIGMGGIGKSTLVRSCLDKKRNTVDTVLYLYFHDSLMDTITDDRQLLVNTVERMKEETTEEYFSRKLSAIRRICEEQRIVLVIDNFEGELGESFAAIREVDWQMIMISRTDPEVDDDPVLYVDAVTGDDRKKLFERYLGREVDAFEESDFESIMDHIQGHTLATEVIAKQIKRKLLTLKQAASITKNVGFSRISDEDIAFSRDGVHAHNVVVRILSDIFAANDLNESERAILQNIALFDMPGIRKDEFIRFSGVSDAEDITDMVLSGWVTEDGNMLSIHPVIRETLKEWSWHQPAISTAKSMMNALVGGDKPLIMSVLKNVKRFETPRQSKEYYDLLCDWLSSDPRDEEEMLLSVKDLISEATEYADPLKLMDSVDFLDYVLCEARLFDDASTVLDIMGDYIRKKDDPFLFGLFYSTLSQFYDCVLNGAYESDEEEAVEIFDCMIDAIKGSIEAMGDAVDMYETEDAEKWVLANYYQLCYVLDYYVMFVRNFTDEQADGDDMYDEVCELKETVESFIEDNADKLSEDKIAELKLHKELTWAWLNTNVTEGEEAVTQTIHRIWAIPSPWKTALDDIDFKYVPCAEMMFRIGFKDESEDILLQAVAICDEHEDVLPYQRKRAELMEHIRDVEELS